MKWGEKREEGEVLNFTAAHFQTTRLVKKSDTPSELPFSEVNLRMLVEEITSDCMKTTSPVFVEV